MRSWVCFNVVGTIAFLVAAIVCPTLAQTGAAVEGDRFDGMEWRFVGPMRGGRTNAVVGHPTERSVFFAGYTGGGVWKTEDAGVSWRNVSDGYFNVGSIGALAIAESRPETIFAGTGEHALRGDLSHGDGVYKSEDGGKTWRWVPLPGQAMSAASFARRMAVKHGKKYCSYPPMQAPLRLR